jgi:5'-nucleotidase
MSHTHPHHRILITNDDGIHAPGIELLEGIARTLSEDVWVVAPDQERSGAGHSISLSLPIRMRQLGPKRYEVMGTPTDCVLMALHEFMTDGPPSLILSGINSGANLAEDVSYSGTCAAAMEGTLLGIRSIALSQIRQPGVAANFAPAEAWAPELLRRLIDLPDWPAGSFLNVNFPDVPAAEVSGVRLAFVGQRPPGSFSIVPRVDARNQPYYWVKIAYTSGALVDASDLHAAAAKAVSVTPIKLDFTDYAWRERLAGLFT